MYRPSFTTYLAHLADRLQAAGFERYPRSPNLASELFSAAAEASRLAGEVSTLGAEHPRVITTVAMLRRVARRHAVTEPTLPRKEEAPR